MSRKPLEDLIDIECGIKMAVAYVVSRNAYRDIALLHDDCGRYAYDAESKTLFGRDLILVDSDSIDGVYKAFVREDANTASIELHDGRIIKLLRVGSDYDDIGELGLGLTDVISFRGRVYVEVKERARADASKQEVKE